MATAQQHMSMGLDRDLVVAGRTRALRKQRQMKQTELAELVGVGPKSVTTIEHGVGLDPDRLVLLASALDCTVAYLLGLTDDPGKGEIGPPQPGITRVYAKAPLAA